MLDLRVVQRMSGSLRPHQTGLTRFPLRVHVVCLKDTEMHLPQLLSPKNPPSTSMIDKERPTTPKNQQNQIYSTTHQTSQRAI